MEEAVERFCAVTGSSAAVAARFLNVAEGDIDHAIAFYFDSDQSEEILEPQINIDESRTPIPQRHERLIDPELPAEFNLRPRNSINHSIFAVDPQRRFQSTTSAGGISNRNGNESSLQKLFEPPVDMLFNGTFEEAKEFAKQRNVWLLVSVHNNDTFDCHRLNRDLWKDVKIKSIVKKNFVFWQVLFNKVEAQNFIQWYGYNKDAAHLAIIDPVTGECKLSLMGEQLTNSSVTYKQIHEFVRNNNRTLNSTKKRSFKEDSGQDLLDLSESIPKIKKMKIISPSSSSYFGEISEEFDMPNKDRWYDYMGLESDMIFTILLRLPSGERDTLSLPSSSKLKALFLYIYEKGCEVNKYELVKCFPKKIFTTEMEYMTLESCGIINKDTIHVQERM